MEDKAKNKYNDEMNGICVVPSTSRYWSRLRLPPQAERTTANPTAFDTGYLGRETPNKFADANASLCGG